MRKMNKLISVLFLAVILGALSIFAYASEIIITPPEDSHNYYVSEIGLDDITYVCQECGETITLTKGELKVMWSTDYINKVPQTSDIDDSAYLDLNNDGIINAKDYSILVKDRSHL